MFGVRTQSDAAATKKTLPGLRELFRRERPRVPVDFTLEVTECGQKLTGIDVDGNKAFVYGDYEFEAAQNDPIPALQRSLAKTGGTPFAMRKAQVEMEEGSWYLPGSAVNEMRRQVLESLLKKRSVPTEKRTEEYSLPEFQPRSRSRQRPLLARFESWEQVSFGAADQLAGLIVPLWDAEKVLPRLREKTFLELPRVMFGRTEEKVRQKLQAAAQMGFAGVQCENIAHLRLARQAGIPMIGGFGLNVTNPLAAQQYADLGLDRILLCPEVQDVEMDSIVPKKDGKAVPTAAIIYGHLPLMVTRACPLHNVHGCAGCSHQGVLTDRKARKFQVRCNGSVRTIYNPVPLYLGDKPGALVVDQHVAWFTLESRKETEEIIAMILNAEPFKGEYTRGLYFKGTSGKE